MDRGDSSRLAFAAFPEYFSPIPNLCSNLVPFFLSPTITNPLQISLLGSSSWCRIRRGRTIASLERKDFLLSSFCPPPFTIRSIRVRRKRFSRVNNDIWKKKKKKKGENRNWPRLKLSFVRLRKLVSSSTDLDFSTGLFDSPPPRSYLSSYSTFDFQGTCIHRLKRRSFVNVIDSRASVLC